MFPPGRSHRFRSFARLAILLPLIPLLQPAAQSSIHIHETPPPEQVTTAVGSVGLSLRTSFTLLDPEQQVLQSFEIADASFELQGETYPALVEALETPWSLVLLADTSKNLGSFTAGATFKAAKNALGSAAGQIPDGATLSIMSFDNDAPTVLAFSQSDEQIAAAIRGLTPKTFGQSCLHDGVYEAINKLGGAPGRRAVIVFTASADDCGARTAAEVVNLAQLNRVQIYPVGLLGYAVTEADLQALSAPTGGLSELRNEETLGFGLSNIMAVLSNQWTARATVYPSAGQQSAVLTINLKDETSLSSPPIAFISSQDYIPPTEINLRGTIQSVATGILFNLEIEQPEQIRQLNVSIISNDTGQAVMAQSMVTFSDVNTIPAAGLITGAEYTLIVNAIDASGQLLAETSADFKYEPPQARLTIASIQAPTLEQPEFVITVDALNLEGAVKFRAWLADPETNVEISGSGVTVPIGEPIVLSSEDLDTGSYAVFVQALDVGDTVLAVTPPVATAYERPSAFEGLRSWISESPLAIAGITGLLCLTVIGFGAVIWLAIISPRRRTRASTVELVMPQKARRVAPSAERPTPAEGTPRPPVEASPQPAGPAPEIVTPAAPPARSKPTPAAPPQPLAVPTARISLRKPREPSFSATVRKTPFSIGRRQGNDAVIPLDSSSGVSGNHLVITYSEGAFHLQDEKSTFGTTINGKTVVKGRSIQLPHGAIIGLGPQVELSFEIEEEA